MVKHTNKILDCGKLKMCPEVNMTINKSSFDLFMRSRNEMIKTQEWIDDRMVTKHSENEFYVESTARTNYAYEKYEEYIKEWDWQNWPKGPDRKKLSERFERWAGGKEALYAHLGIIPFIPSVMINISPDWKGEGFHPTNCTSVKIKVLKEIVENYLKEGWYSKASYVIENGGDGKHIHVHIVAEFSPDRIKSTNTHLAKGRHTVQLKKYAKHIKGMEGIIKGTSVHKVFLRTELLVKDKLKYLIEEEKPMGHKNKSKICPVVELVF